MKIGVFSDSHDHLTNIEKAVCYFVDERVSYVIHCGDYVAPFIDRVLKNLETANIIGIGVYGNNDGERIGLERRLNKIMPIYGDFHETIIEEKKIAIYHGTDKRILDSLIYSQKYDLILTGHTHQIRVEQVKNTFIVNPGETCGYLTGKASCALIELNNEKIDLSMIKIHEI